MTSEAREDHDDRGQFCIYDENVVRRHADGEVETHALWVANPPNGRILPGPPQDWPDILDSEDAFDDEPDIGRVRGGYNGTGTAMAAAAILIDVPERAG